MPHNPPQQQQMANPAFMKSAATPQHGRKPDTTVAKIKDKRTVQPTPGH